MYPELAQFHALIQQKAIFGTICINKQQEKQNNFWNLGWLHELP